MCMTLNIVRACVGVGFENALCADRVLSKEMESLIQWL